MAPLKAPTAQETSELPMCTQAFPPTRKTWIGQMLGQEETGRQSINRHLMEVYVEPLEVYFQGTSYRFLGEPKEIVHGFLASRLTAPDYFVRWESSGLPLRRWLMNGLIFYLKELAAEPRKRSGDCELSDVMGDPAPGPAAQLEMAYDKSYVVAIVRRTLDSVREYCQERSLNEHWHVFARHYFEDLTYADAAVEIGVSATRAKEMTRAPRDRFRAVLRDTLIHDGVAADRVDDEITFLQQLGES